MFYENLKESCAKNNTNVTNLLKKLNLPTANTGSWKKGMLPKGETLKLIAKELNVSTDYLLGLTEQKENNFSLIKTEEKEEMKFYNLDFIKEAHENMKKNIELYGRIVEDETKESKAIDELKYHFLTLKTNLNNLKEVPEEDMAISEINLKMNVGDFKKLVDCEYLIDEMLDMINSTNIKYVTKDELAKLQNNMATKDDIEELKSLIKAMNPPSNQADNA